MLGKQAAQRLRQRRVRLVLRIDGRRDADGGALAQVSQLECGRRELAPARARGGTCGLPLLLAVVVVVLGRHGRPALLLLRLVFRFDAGLPGLGSTGSGSFLGQGLGRLLLLLFHRGWLRRRLPLAGPRHLSRLRSDQLRGEGGEARGKGVWGGAGGRALDAIRMHAATVPAMQAVHAYDQNILKTIRVSTQSFSRRWPETPTPPDHLVDEVRDEVFVFLEGIWPQVEIFLKPFSNGFESERPAQRRQRERGVGGMEFGLSVVRR